MFSFFPATLSAQDQGTEAKSQEEGKGPSPASHCWSYVDFFSTREDQNTKKQVLSSVYFSSRSNVILSWSQERLGQHISSKICWKTTNLGNMIGRNN